MRTRRMCEKKPSGKLLVDDEIHNQYKNGGMEREQLEMALLESLAKHGLNRTNYKRVKARTQQSCWSIIGIVKPLGHPMFSINHPCSIPCCIMLPKNIYQPACSGPLTLQSLNLMPLSCLKKMVRHQGEFLQKCKVIRERMESRSTEELGKWLTESALRKSKEFTASDVKNIINYCRKFPESLTRPINHINN